MSNHQRVVLETKELNNRQFEYELAINVGAEGAHNFEVVITHEEKTYVFFHATMRKALDYMEACMAADSQDYIRKAAAEFADNVLGDEDESTDEIVAGNLLEREYLDPII